MPSGIFAILDDIAMLLDDASAMSKIAAKKTAGILGDDLAVNAEKATGFHASRELPVIWAITKGSLINKIIIIPAALFLSAYVPWLIVPILLLGGAYLCFEGTEKIYEWLAHRCAKDAHEDNYQQTAATKLSEKEKIRSAVRTDFILSIEIIIIALESVLDQQLLMQILVVGFVALLATVGVYGLVALLVKLDDMGFYLVQYAQSITGPMSKILTKVGEILIASLPKIIRFLEFVGTLAMLLVGGGMYVHNIEVIHDGLHFMPTMLASLFAGLIVGFVTLFLLHSVTKTK
ncbi:Inner membrane protein YedI [Candidatus Electrothrix laxa]